MTEEINVQRRRKDEDGPSGRAEAPTGPGGGGSGRGSGGMRAAGGALGGCGSLIVLVCMVIFYLLGGGNATSDDEDEPVVTRNPSQVVATRTRVPTREPSTDGGNGPTWLVMLYQDADDDVLEEDIFTDLNEAERVGSSEQVTIVSQLDRYKGAFKGDDNWKSARRYYITQDDDLKKINSEMVEDLGEVSMARKETLVDFATWAIENYPADHYVLVLSDHGMGWPGGWSDPTPKSADPGTAPLIRDSEGDQLYLSEIDEALDEIRQKTGIKKFDILGLDACLMSQIEVYAALEPHASYAIASEETEPALGWAYTAFLQTLHDNPEISARDLSELVVKTYINQDQLIVDDDARKDYWETDASARDVINENSSDITLTAVDLAALPALMERFNEFAFALQNEDQAAIASARNYTQSYSAVFGEKKQSSYLDLGHFAQMALEQTGSAELKKPVNALLAAMKKAIVAEKHGKGRPGSTGMAFYFPNTTLYRSAYSGLKSYTQVANRFTETSLWDEYLLYYYNDKTFDLDAAGVVTTPGDKNSRSPGAGKITVSALTASKKSAKPGENVKLSAEIGGSNIGHIYLMIGLKDAESGSILLADTDFLESSDTRNVENVYYPVWPEKKFKLNYEWNLGVFNISDGSTTALALFHPQSYGADADEATYMVEGTYTFTEDGTQKYAQLLFKKGKLFQILGYTGNEKVGAPAEIRPQPGDTFTLINTWLEMDDDDNLTQSATQDGQTLTFGDEPFTWDETYTPAGSYVVGFIVEDMDGQQKATYTTLTVK